MRDRISCQKGPHDHGDFSYVVTANVIGTFNVTRLAAFANFGSGADVEGECGIILNTAATALSTWLTNDRGTKSRPARSFESELRAASSVTARLGCHTVPICHPATETWTECLTGSSSSAQFRPRVDGTCR